MIQVRNVPDRLHRELVRRAQAQGETLTRYVQGILAREVGRPSAAEIFARIHARTRVDLVRPVAEVIHAGRVRRGGA